MDNRKICDKLKRNFHTWNSWRRPPGVRGGAVAVKAPPGAQNVSQ